MLNAFEKVISQLQVPMFANYQQAKALAQTCGMLLSRLISSQFPMLHVEALTKEAIAWTNSSRSVKLCGPVSSSAGHWNCYLI
jgi:hypothetical protein